ncbi:PilZ domain-containing protein [Devosia sp. 2618]|uniref:PilZ domain-containing protein n=1 Tax=Devosia sp. 2618 TaxID=3156454 RepID=UPI0033950044
MNAQHNKARSISSVAGRYVLGNQPKRPGVNLFACRLRSISPSSFAVAAPVIGAVGEMVSASFEPFGSVRGRISRLMSDGFVVDIECDHLQQAALAQRVDSYWHKPWLGLAERRAEQRYMPAEPRSVIILDDGTPLPCLVVDFSAIGASVSAAVQPKVGDHVTVGHVSASVVRIFDVGFAVAFNTPQPEDEIEGLLEAPQEWRKAVAVLPTGRIDTREAGDSDEGYGYD